MILLWYIVLATLLVSLVSLLGIVMTHKRISSYLVYFVAFAAAVLLSASFFDLLPEALESGSVDIEIASLVIFLGILVFFFIERYLHWHHCGSDVCVDHGHEHVAAGTLVFWGDLLHNFVDGILIAGAFLLNIPTGIIATIVVAIHEIPQELADFAVFLHSGYSVRRALFANFVSSLSAIIGGVLGFYVLDGVNAIVPYVVLFATGGFLYIALSDIIPSLHEKGKSRFQLTVESIIIVVTVVCMWFFLESLHHLLH